MTAYEIQLWGIIVFLMVWACFITVCIYASVDQAKEKFAELNSDLERISRKSKELRSSMESAWKSANMCEDQAREIDKQNRELREKLAALRIYKNSMERNGGKVVLP